ncbi:arsenic resistance protein [Corynebacterium pacaense]|uniref:arsenic resistance protein n=1 Tax=Corynebacterium pacaense TaxID=1816684 RepID=UPI0009BBA5E5|nr:arsenic resistance protein [Corynebacterium pacaense]
MVEWWNRHQVVLYILALAFGAGLGLVTPGVAGHLESAINPVLMLLLYATFLGVPFVELPRVFRDARFLGAVVILNFIIVPVVVYLLTRPVAAEPALAIGVMLVLLAPCIDYVIVFSGIAGAANDRLLAVSPLLMLLQMLLLPVYMSLFSDAGLGAIINIGPFIEAFVLLILVPLALAAATQFIARTSRAGVGVCAFFEALMVPLMMLTLAVVVASQILSVRSELGALLAVIPIFVAFLIIMVPLGILVGRMARQDTRGIRALVFSGATRNSLVVLPLALALPAELALVAAVVVTQTLVELVGMIVYVRVVPFLVR